MAKLIYTSLEADAAICVWEAMLAAQAEAGRPTDCTGNLCSMAAMWERRGAFAMRQCALPLGVLVCEVADLLPAAVRECWLFDTEIVPLILAEIRWVDDGAEHDGPARIAGRLVDALTRAAA